MAPGKISEYCECRKNKITLVCIAGIDHYAVDTGSSTFQYAKSCKKRVYADGSGSMIKGPSHTDFIEAKRERKINDCSNSLPPPVIQILSTVSYTFPSTIFRFLEMPGGTRQYNLEDLFLMHHGYLPSFYNKHSSLLLY